MLAMNAVLWETSTYLAGVPGLCADLCGHHLICLLCVLHLWFGEPWNHIMKLEPKELQPATDICTETDAKHCKAI